MKPPEQDEANTDVFRHLASALAPYLKGATAPANQKRTEYYSQKDSPLGRRMHLDLVRRGDLQGSKVGKLVLVKRELVDKFISAHRVTPPQTPTGEQEESDPLDDWGLERSGQ